VEISETLRGFNGPGQSWFDQTFDGSLNAQARQYDNRGITLGINRKGFGRPLVNEFSTNKPGVLVIAADPQSS